MAFRETASQLGNLDPRQRSLERLRAHWEIERELADRLRQATREERLSLYGTVYDELFRRVPDHPQIQWKGDPAQRTAEARDEAARIARFLPEDGVFLEIGAGDCALSFAVAQRASRVIAVEVSREMADAAGAPDNFELAITNGIEIPVFPGSVDLAYSNQLMEHLHPADAAEQLAQIFLALAPGGHYVCFTPNRLLGPADISMYFEDDVPSGFHLREYDNRELRDLFKSAGFASVHTIAIIGGRLFVLPLAVFSGLEALFERLPRVARRRLKRLRLVQKLLWPGGGVVARKA